MTGSDAQHAETTDLSATRRSAAVILAAGKGTRMHSAKAKVLHEIGGAPMLAHVLEAVKLHGCEHRVLVVGHQADQVSMAARRVDHEIEIAPQEPQLGTAHAVLQAREQLDGFTGDVFVLYGDVPLIRPETMAQMAAARAGGAELVALGFDSPTPKGYGRLIRSHDGRLDRIVEEKDATDRERAVSLCNSGVLCVSGAKLFVWLDRVRADNAQGEYYLTDLVAIARAAGATCAVVTADADEAQGVNSPVQLAEAEAAFQRRRRRELMEKGVVMLAPDTVFLSADTVIGADVVIEANVVFAPGVSVGDGARIRAFSHLEGCRVHDAAVVGPYARLRRGADIGVGARVGNFVEVKNATLGPGAKASHLTYLGDASIGAEANIGAGTITCNYDGYFKHRTEIGAGAFIGSNSALVAPVSIGDGAIVAAGSTITEDVEADALALGRARQATRPGLGARMREALKSEEAAGDGGDLGALRKRD